MSRAAILLLALLAGCQPAVRYDPRPGKDKDAPPDRPDKPPAVRPLSEDLNWINPGRTPDAGQIRIEFVHEATKPEEWAKLKAFWNDPGLVKAGDPPRPVKIKVPLGLDDPTPYIPPDSPPTRERWELGKRLFFDAELLGTKQSCASCHIPRESYTDGKKAGGGEMNTPTLVNVVYGRSLFWDGRATYLEEAVQRTLEDERTSETPFRHAWPGVIGRLRASKEYRDAFKRAFADTLPTQDSAGQVLATYMRTLLAAGSLHDRADALRRRDHGDVVRPPQPADSLHDLADALRRSTKSIAMTAAHYEALLDADAMKRLDKVGSPKAIVAADLLKGHTLFTGQAGCSMCHPAGNGVFTDGRFHNVDVDASDIDSYPSKRGRFNVAPLGEKSRWLMGAWKTPTLRGLSRTAPYFHNGQETQLVEAVRHHVRQRGPGETLNIFLSPLLAKPDGNHKDFGLARGDVEAITLFLRALDGQEVDAFVRNPPG